MKAFMLGWEFPPFISGGLGTACYGLTKALDKMGVQVTFVLPKASGQQQTGQLKMIGTDSASVQKLPDMPNVIFKSIPSMLQPYMTSFEPASYQKKANPGNLSHFGRLRGSHNYGGNMYEEVNRYARRATYIAAEEDFDLVHAHDWMTYPAGMAVAQAKGKPLIVQVHSTEFDRSGENINQVVYDIERAGMHAAKRVITVSQYTRNIVITRYGVPAEKVEVVHNGVEEVPDYKFDQSRKIQKTVLYLGRITMQKGPEYFIGAAKRVLEVVDAKFIMAGHGDMALRMVEYAAHLGIGHKVLFSGFLNGYEVSRAFQMADLYVMPSVSEPFGICGLEALRHKVPVLVSRNSGIAEVLIHILKVNFWDIDEMANKIAAVLKYQPLHETLRDNGYRESRSFTWDNSAAKCLDIYNRMQVA